ncbi:MAG: response regulator [Chloroflexi bacterium]|nr:response regulator [Chloroflexota bacterium]
MAGKVILLVEDNSDDVDLTLRAIKRNNIANDVIIARDGVEALDYLFATGSQQGNGRLMPAVVLLDLRLPRLDGLDVLQRMRSDGKTRCIPVVVLTSSKEEQDLVKSYSLGANSYVRKPVDFNQFHEAIRLLGLYWLLLNEPPPIVGSA